jgi:hypothetical protein
MWNSPVSTVGSELPPFPLRPGASRRDIPVSTVFAVAPAQAFLRSRCPASLERPGCAVRGTPVHRARVHWTLCNAPVHPRLGRSGQQSTGLLSFSGSPTDLHLVPPHPLDPRRFPPPPVCARFRGSHRVAGGAPAVAHRRHRQVSHTKCTNR